MPPTYSYKKLCDIVPCSNKEYKKEDREEKKVCIISPLDTAFIPTQLFTSQGAISL